jgi:hypothetical protein
MNEHVQERRAWVKMSRTEGTGKDVEAERAQIRVVAMHG